MLARLKSLWRNLWHRDRVNDDLDREVRAVFDILVDEKTRAGLPIEQARRSAALELGREASITQQVREARAGASVDAVSVAFGFRLLFHALQSTHRVPPSVSEFMCGRTLLDVSSRLTS